MIIEGLNLVELPTFQLLIYYVTKIIAQLLPNTQQVVYFLSFSFFVVTFFFQIKRQAFAESLLTEKEKEIAERKDS